MQETLTLATPKTSLLRQSTQQKRTKTVKNIIITIGATS